jgi:hypothetical protein
LKSANLLLTLLGNGKCGKSVRKFEGKWENGNFGGGGK